MKLRHALIASAIAAGSLPLVAGAQDSSAEPKQWTKTDFVNKAAERAARHFEKADANNDDVLSPEERRAYREELREQRRAKMHKNARHSRAQELRDAS
ncbi:MAG: hypothetical protein P3W96_006280 [Halomonas sp.]|nr:hypothetical protein [Halomonas sp.]MDM7481609.1 hypothetical protein [Halomonas sp.]